MKAQELITKVFDIVDGSWRGLGKIPVSALALNKENSEFDARRKYDVKVENSIDLLPGCLCHLVMVGKIKPPGCGLFMNKCTPNTPRGACMVSMEGTCRIWATHSP
jgi:hydrogenase expression/formation protein HypD